MTDASQRTQAAKGSTSIDLPTIAAIAIVSYLLGSIFHEVLGHGLAAVLVGGQIEHFSSVDLAWSKEGIPVWAVRLVAAAGCVANVALGLAALAALKRLRHRLSPVARYFMWLLGHINLFIAGGYLMALSLAPFGDWNTFTEGLSFRLLWRLGLTGLGIAISFATLFHAVRTIELFIGASQPARKRRAASLTLFPYLVGSTVTTISGLFNPVGIELVFISAIAASFGGTAFLGWVFFWVMGKAWGESVSNPITPARDWLWLGMGILGVVVYVFVLGPGLPR